MVSQEQPYVAELEGADWIRKSDGGFAWRFTYQEGKWKAFSFAENKIYNLTVTWHEAAQI